MENFSGNKLFEIFFPGKNFPAISITGEKCSLNCAHCSGFYLKHMLKADSKNKLLKLCKKLNDNKANGALISGGSNQVGHVMLEQYFDVFKEIKQNTDLLLNVHTGILSRTQAKDLADSGIDVASVDVVGNSNTIKNVYGLNHSPDAYNSTLLALKDAGLKKIVPHICIGLDYGKVKGEFRAIDIISTIKPDVLVLIVLIPTQGTEMADCEPPSINNIIKVIKYAKLKLNTIKIYLGCMRPKNTNLRNYNQKLEICAINAGISGIVLPTKTTISYLNEQNFIIKSSETCCAVV